MNFHLIVFSKLNLKFDGKYHISFDPTNLIKVNLFYFIENNFLDYVQEIELKLCVTFNEP